MATNETTDTETTEEQGPLSVFSTDGVSAVGRATTRALAAAGYKVTAVVQTTEAASQVREDGGLPVSVDLLRMGEIKGMMQMAEADVVVHLVPQAYNEPPFYAPGLPTSTLVDGTKAVVEAAKAAGVTFIVHTSFAYLYGTTGVLPVDETANLAKEKDELFAAAREAEKIVRGSEIPFTILRAGFVYGAGSALMNNLSDAIRAGKPPAAGEKNYANWVYSKDLAQAVALTVEKQPAGEVFNIAGDTAVMPQTFLDDLGGALGISPDRTFSFLSRMFSMPTRPHPALKVSTKVKSSKAHDILGWSPKYASHMAGIEEMLIDWRASMST